MHSKSLPVYSDINQTIEESEWGIHPSEIHGRMSGILSAGANKQLIWDEFAPEMNEHQEPYQALEDLYKYSQQQLEAFLFEFQMLLPDDSAAILTRAEALNLWCQGYLTGLKLAGIELENRKPSEMTAVIKDLFQIAQMNYEAVQESEENEADYTELVEYVRMAVIFIYQTQRENGEQSKTEQLH